MGHVVTCNLFMVVLLVTKQFLKTCYPFNLHWLVLQEEKQEDLSRQAKDNLWQEG